MAPASLSNANGLRCSTCGTKGLSSCGSLLGEFGKRLDEQGLTFKPVQRTVHARRNIYIAGEASEDAYIMCSGWACRLVRLPDGRCQILSFLLPGDLFSAAAPFQEQLDFYVEAITEVRYAAMNRAAIRSKLSEDPRTLEAFMNLCIAETKDANQMLTELGQRTADEHIARLILHLMERLSMRGMVHDQSFEFPLRQQHIADAMGLTPVHISRVMSVFRQDGLIEIHDGKMKVRDLEELRRIAGIK
jgi:CRP/FNR family transcriptional regulator